MDRHSSEAGDSASARSVQVYRFYLTCVLYGTHRVLQSVLYRSTTYA